MNTAGGGPDADLVLYGRESLLLYVFHYSIAVKQLRAILAVFSGAKIAKSFV